MKIKNTFMAKLLMVTFFLLIFSPMFVMAQPPITSGPPTVSNPPQTPGHGVIPIGIDNPVGGPNGVNSLTDLFIKIVNFVISFSYIVVAFFLILSGFKFVTAQGSEDKLKEAKSTFKNTIIGAILVIGAQVIVSVLKSIITQLGA